ncbi:hypothetical protein H6G27_26460 [Nostoc linckia FACHB-104]|nr:hypothetical protein [Nostoc linckia FACHB-104]
MNYTQDMTYARIVSLYKAYLAITEIDAYHVGHLLNLERMAGMIQAYLECAYLPEDREQMRMKAYLEAYRMYTDWK